MPKNVEVVDETGNVYEATYPKRARGLVKNGRARYITDNKIVLARPPEIKTEDNIMSENTYNAISPEEILKRIDAIIADSGHITNALLAAQDVDMAGAMQPHPLGVIIQARETTNQRLISLLEKMYDDTQGKRGAFEEFEEKAAAIFNNPFKKEDLEKVRDAFTEFGGRFAQTGKDVGQTFRNMGHTAKEAAKAARDSVRASREAGEPHYDDEPEEEDDTDE
ncbi:MAG: hypothetical protein LBN00_00420 [Oscillospiraceae bacterium]|nr:hypothetical protein [Oscillospiraceae bacterium]